MSLVMTSFIPYFLLLVTGPRVNICDFITVSLSSTNTPASVSPSMRAFTVGYQFGASMRLFVGGDTTMNI